MVAITYIKKPFRQLFLLRPPAVVMGSYVEERRVQRENTRINIVAPSELDALSGNGAQVLLRGRLQTLSDLRCELCSCG